MQASVEADFAAAVLFLQTYNGPHRILRNPTSSVRLDFDALFQQATLGSCSTTAPMDGMEQSSWTKWKALGNMSKEAAMQKYIKMMDELVDEEHQERDVNQRRWTTGGAARHFEWQMLLRQLNPQCNLSLRGFRLSLLNLTTSRRESTLTANDMKSFPKLSTLCRMRRSLGLHLVLL
ncbi:unnamed protein product [Aphanomyces euteiches]